MAAMAAASQTAYQIGGSLEMKNFFCKATVNYGLNRAPARTLLTNPA